MQVDRLDQLLVKVRAGDENAYRQFLAKAAERLRANLRRSIAGDAELEDIVQECLIAIHNKRHTIDPARPVAPWLRAIGQYKLIDHWRKRGRSPISYLEADIAVAPETLASHDINSLLSQLPDQQAEAIRMTQIEGLSGDEASERAGIGLSAMKLRIHRGMKKLRKIVETSQ